MGDDDTYIVIPNLVKTLRRYDYNGKWYIGKNSLSHKYRTIEQSTKKVCGAIYFLKAFAFLAQLSFNYTCIYMYMYIYHVFVIKLPLTDLFSQRLKIKP